MCLYMRALDPIHRYAQYGSFNSHTMAIDAIILLTITRHECHSLESPVYIYIPYIIKLWTLSSNGLALLSS